MFLLQTASGEAYEQMLEATSGRHRKFAILNSMRRCTYIGVKRGYFDWHAAYNRIPLIAEIYRDGFRGWLLYIDADAFVADLSFDVEGFINTYRNKLIIAAPGSGQGGWDLNNGVFFLNCGHQDAPAFIEKWNQEFSSQVSNEILEQAIHPWSPLSSGQTFPDDQTLMQNILKHEPFLTSIALVHDILNYHNGSFIKQALRATGMTPLQRQKWILRSVCDDLNANVLKQFNDADLIDQLYVGLLGRHVDPIGSGVFREILNQENSLIPVVQGIISSQEYNRLL